MSGGHQGILLQTHYFKFSRSLVGEIIDDTKAVKLAHLKLSTQIV
jgi:hypothetical protein